ncbi:hypothetical protein KR51_00003220 [Rubidibacter lacunae KORDI 51-2]|uniref:Uncharacterized protein n=2 Tax=Rubidibacter TaxID=582491 RepID=U5DQW4_9CHRO|nr:hypothetical protein KR51_00003220 [Rubidibacter lacunae KORDI 51-2]
MVVVTTETLRTATGLTPREQEYARLQLTQRELLVARPLQGSGDLWEYAPNFEALEGVLGNVPSSVESPLRAATSATTATSDPHFPARGRQRTVSVTPDYRFSGPWESQEQLEAFQRALLDYAVQQGISRPSGWTFAVVDGMTKGLISPFWDEFVAGEPLGASQQIAREWEVESGVPYPAFEEERVRYFTAKGEPLESALARARSELRDPVRGRDLWDGFLRKCDRLADEALSARSRGVSTPYLPPSFTDRAPVTKASVMAKLAAANGASALEPTEPAGSPPAAIAPSNAAAHSAHVPDLETLRATYRQPMGKTMVARQIAAHPEWGYHIVEGTIVERRHSPGSDPPS